MVVLDPPQITYAPLGRVLERQKTVPPESYGVRTARALNISFGD